MKRPAGARKSGKAERTDKSGIRRRRARSLRRDTFRDLAPGGVDRSGGRIRGRF
jgi:hypothetical protein